MMHAENTKSQLSFRLIESCSVNEMTKMIEAGSKKIKCLDTLHNGSYVLNENGKYNASKEIIINDNNS
jgi:hypothetical protein